MKELDFFRYLDLATKQLGYTQEERNDLYSSLKTLLNKHEPDEVQYLLDKWANDQAERFNSSFNSGKRKSVKR